MYKISIIGYGNMAKAICEGLLKSPHYSLQVAAPSLTAAVVHPRLRSSSNNLTVIQEADVLILAVKPIHMADVLSEMSPHLPSKLLVVSVAAGLDMSWYARQVAPETPLVRAIPNLAAACQQSATPLIANAWVTASQHHLASSIFLQCGEIAWTDDEQDLDTMTALSGSGLAYLFAFTRAMREGAISLGLTPELANQVAIQTLAGAGSLAKSAQRTLEGLQQQVASKGGTTEAALAVFAEHQLSHIVLSAMHAAVTRSRNLRNEEK